MPNSFEEEAREILEIIEKFASPNPDDIGGYDIIKSPIFPTVAQEISKLNALKPKVDEGKLYNTILDFNKKSEWDELPIQLIQDLAHAIALKKDEWLKGKE